MSEHWKGIGKLVEECGEVLQLCGKAIPFPTGNHPDGLGSIDTRIELELGDLLAAIAYVIDENGLDGEMIHTRKAHKLYKFKEWGLTGIQEHP